MSVAPPIASGRFETKIAASSPALDRLAARQPDAEHHLLGDPVEERAERERRAAAHARRRGPAATK